MTKLKKSRTIAALLAAILLFFSAPITVFATQNGIGVQENYPQTGLSEGAAEQDDQPTAAEDSPTDEADSDEEEKPAKPVISGYDMELGYPPVDNYTVDGTAAMLYDLNSDTVIFTQNPNDKIYPASLTKMMTALVIVEHCDLSEPVTITANAVNSVEARTGDVMIGEQMTMLDLLYCILVASSNESAAAAAEHVSGSFEAFVDLMNEKAKELGCRGTHFANPHGLHDDDHYTTVHDLLLISKAVLANDQLREICFTTAYEMPETNMQEAHTVHTTNYMTSTALSSKYYYSYAKGVKTGYTGKAGRCLVTTAEYGNLNLLAIVTGCRTEDIGNGELLMHSFFEAENLFKHGFNNYEYTVVLSPLEPVAEVSVDGGENASVVVAPVEEHAIALPNDYDPKDITTEVTVQNGSIQAPFSAGDVVGSVTVYYQGKEIRRADITPIVNMAAADPTQSSETVTSAPATPADVDGKTRVSFWTVLVILAGLFLVLYIASYVYNNMTRGKPAAKKSPRRKRTGTPQKHRKTVSSSRRSPHRSNRQPPKNRDRRTR